MLLSYLKLRQNDLQMYLVVLNAKQLIEMAYIDHFDAANINGHGYQRPPIPTHYKKITKYFIDDIHAFLPTAILAAANPSNLIELSGGKLQIDSKITIVDGQHRIEGIKNIQSVDTQRYEQVLTNYEFPVIIMAINEDDRSFEINAFININKKGKPVSTDLAMQLLDKLNREKSVNITNITKEMIDKDFALIVATEITSSIGNIEKSSWYQLIKFGDDITRQKPISISAFAKSILPIVRKILLAKAPLDKQKEIKTKNAIIEIIDEAWLIIKGKWPQCFTDEKSSGYNIRKSVGVYSLHIILEDCIDEVNVDMSCILGRFKSIIENSPIVYLDWIEGGKFSGMTNSQSLRRVANMIRGLERESDLLN